jgi:hypothetical protein
MDPKDSLRLVGLVVADAGTLETSTRPSGARGPPSFQRPQYDLLARIYIDRNPPALHHAETAARLCPGGNHDRLERLGHAGDLAGAVAAERRATRSEHLRRAGLMCGPPGEDHRGRGAGGRSRGMARGTRAPARIMRPG